MESSSTNPFNNAQRPAPAPTPPPSPTPMPFANQQSAPTPAAAPEPSVSSQPRFGISSEVSSTLDSAPATATAGSRSAAQPASSAAAQSGGSVAALAQATPVPAATTTVSAAAASVPTDSATASPAQATESAAQADRAAADQSAAIQAAQAQVSQHAQDTKVAQTTPTTPSANSSSTSSALPPEFRGPAHSAEDFEPDTPATPKSRSKIIALISIIAGLIVVGVAVAIIVVTKVTQQEDPETIAMEAVSHLIDASQKAIILNGEISLTPAEGSMPGVSGITLTIDSNTAGSTSSSNATLRLALASGGDIEVSAGNVILEDGKIFLTLAGLADAIDAYLDTLGITIDYLSLIPESESLVALYEAASAIEDEWWEISLADLGMEEDYFTMAYGDDYTCVSEALSDPNVSAEIEELYKNNRFLAANKDASFSTPTYKMEIKPDVLRDFLSAANHLSIADRLRECTTVIELDDAMNSIESMSGEIEEVADDIESIDDQLDEQTDDVLSLESFLSALPTIYAEINGDHYFTRIFFDISSDSLQTSVNLKLSYPASLTISAPEEYRPFSELIDEIMVYLQSANSIL